MLRRDAIISGVTIGRLERLGAAYRASLSTVFSAAAALYLSRMTGATDVVLGMPMAARTNPKMRRVVGLATNTVPLRLSVDPGMPIGTLLQQAGRQIRGAMRHQRYRASELRRDLGLTPDQPALYGLIVNFMPIDEDVDFAGVHDPEARSLVLADRGFHDLDQGGRQRNRSSDQLQRE